MRNKRKTHESSGNQSWLSLLTAEDNDAAMPIKRLNLQGPN
jgi:hypothetical protein